MIDDDDVDVDDHGCQNTLCGPHSCDLYGRLMRQKIFLLAIMCDKN